MLPYDKLHYIEYEGIQLELHLTTRTKGPFFRKRTFNVLYVGVLQLGENREDTLLLSALKFAEAYVNQNNQVVDEYRVYFAPLLSVHETMVVKNREGISRR